jgi:hypothetical protein
VGLNSLKSLNLTNVYPNNKNNNKNNNNNNNNNNNKNNNNNNKKNKNKSKPLELRSRVKTCVIIFWLMQMKEFFQKIVSLSFNDKYV